MIKLITPESAVRIIDDVTGQPSLEQLRDWISCEYVEVPGGVGFQVGQELQQFVMDENGKLLGKPINWVATALYDHALSMDPRGFEPRGDVLVGNIVILTGEHLLT